METSKNLTAQSTQGELMFSQGDSPAKTYRLRTRRLRASRVGAADYGSNTKGSLLKLYLDSSQLKTCLSYYERGLRKSYTTFPKSGTMRNGNVYQRISSASTTDVSASLLLLTPSAQMWKAWTFLNPYALIRKNHADGNLQEQLMRLYQRMITPECVNLLMGYPKSWAHLKAEETPLSLGSPMKYSEQ